MEKCGRQTTNTRLEHLNKYRVISAENGIPLSLSIMEAECTVSGYREAQRWRGGRDHRHARQLPATRDLNPLKNEVE